MPAHILWVVPVVAYRIFQLLKRDCLQALGFTWRWFMRPRPWLFSALAAAVVAGVIWVLPWDDAAPLVLKPTDQETREAVKQTAQALSFYGDFAGFNVALFVILLSAGWLLRSRKFMRIAVASLLCASLSGLCANVIRSATGRPRPSTKAEDRLHGPSFSSAYQALPSAHTATAFGGALPVLLSAPVMGAPLTVAAAGVGWSRMQLNRHHLTDVLASVPLSFLFSLPLTRWAMLGRMRTASTLTHAPDSSRPPH